MAVLIQLHMSPSAQELFDDLDSRVGESMASAGGPPAGLMSHVAYPEDGGFVIADVWRTEQEGRTYIDEVLTPLLLEVGLTLREISARPVWSFARP
ncbi:hypothetical protein [Nocardioides euryhalodurans]|uniref:ABM domain-containing protein n=1 Tax=Nocardioides euryhalodurans TaxID=2518370 RepID=A0A4P7GLP6_9ACTN|nr:hypothetical protein [Nocardioides euryhalodurans]QBR92744.1 hypothetical protein EXE57_10990 [Nocardioides euryhalodurans]